MSSANSQGSNAGAGKNLLALPAGVELGQYRIIRKLGQGGFGITYLAEVVSTGEQVVIKENLPTFCAMRARSGLDVLPTDPDDELQEYAEYLRRFVDEARLLAQLSHPNIVKVLGAFEALGTAYYVMPWVGGKELQKAAPAPGVITESWLLPILRTMLSTLEYLHSKNIYHRDVKPANILLTEEGTPVLIDFGTARAIISDRSATHVGSPGYSPIEQITARGKRGPWTDVYSLGATCYRLITGENPPEANERLAEEEDPLLPLAHCAELRGCFSSVFLATIDKALALRGKDRWQTATEWLATLPKSAPQSVADIPTTPISVAGRPAPRPRRNVVLIALILVLALGIPGGYVLYQHAQTVAEQRLFAQQEAERIAKEEAERKAREDAKRKLQEKGISESQYNSKIVEISDRGDSELLSLLIAAGADVNAVDRYVKTPLMRAVDRGHTECVRRLLAAPGIDVNKSGEFGWTPLYIAVNNGRTECVRLLLAAPGIDVNVKDKDSNTSLYRAVVQANTEIVWLLLAAPGIDTSCFTPLSLAVIMDDRARLRSLLSEAGVDVNEASKGDETPLYLATNFGYTECVRLLLATTDIDVNKSNEWGFTPLHRAASKGFGECVKLLLAAPGIDVNRVNKYGRTPRKKAELKGHTECARLIRAAGGR